MDTTETQVAVIGAGPGGYSAAFRAADLGLAVTLIDPAPNPGGVCLYRGCMPTKALLHAAAIITTGRKASRIGLRYSEPEIDLARLQQWKERVVTGLTQGLGQLARARKVRYVQGTAEFIDAGSLLIQASHGSEEQLLFEHAIIATGSRPAIIKEVSAGPRVWDSTSALAIAQIPSRLLVVGGGYIGLELGTIYASLGSRVTIAEIAPVLMPGMDQELVKIYHKSAKDLFASIRLDTTAQIIQKGDGLRAVFKSKGEQAEETFDQALIAVGRIPNTDNAGMENTRIELDHKGFIKTNDQRRTNEESIFAIGDAAGGPLLAHKAMAEGRIAAEVIAGHKVFYEPKAVPAVAYIQPEMAWCGLNEVEASKRGISVGIGRFPWAASGRAATLDENDGLTKIVVEADTSRILGMGMVGNGAGELIAEGVLAVEMAATAQDLELAIHPHPTLSETSMEAATEYFGRCTHLYHPKGHKHETAHRDQEHRQRHPDFHHG